MESPLASPLLGVREAQSHSRQREASSHLSKHVQLNLQVHYCPSSHLLHLFSLSASDLTSQQQLSIGSRLCPSQALPTCVRAP